MRVRYEIKIGNNTDVNVMWSKNPRQHHGLGAAGLLAPSFA